MNSQKNGSESPKMALNSTDLKVIQISERIMELEKSLFSWETKQSPEGHYLKRANVKAAQIKDTLAINYKILEYLKGSSEDKKKKLYYN